MLIVHIIIFLNFHSQVFLRYCSIIIFKEVSAV
nr:MAG TPA: hypothetical protein [Caudoviricetes sp.]